MINRYINTDRFKRYYTLDYYYRKKYNSKVFKVSLNGGFSCPNKDGTVGVGGCIYCSKLGSGDFAGDIKKGLITQFYEVKNIMEKKWPNSLYIGYFQANTNTYDDVNNLKKRYEPILNLDNVVGLSIATRPDSITNECLDYLIDLNKRTNLTIELGLQTIHESTTKFINRGHDLNCFTNMVNTLRKNNIEVVVHIINGLPYETKEMMIDTVKYLNNLNIQGIKIHMLHVIKNTKLADIYDKEHFHILTRDEYVDIVCDQLEYLNKDIVIHRITGDAKKDDLIEPLWTLKKFDVMNSIDKELTKRGTFQGFNDSIINRLNERIDRIVKPNDIVIDFTNNQILYDKVLKNNYINNLTDTDYETYKNKISFILLDNSADIDKYLNLLNNKGVIIYVSDSFEDKYNSNIYSSNNKYLIEIKKSH